MKMVKAAAAIAAISACAVASAQSGNLDTTPTGISVRAGIAISMDSGLTNNVASSLIGLGLEYRFSSSLLKSGETYISLDYMTKNFSGNKGTIMPLAINQRFFMAKQGTNRRTYGFLGIGIAVTDVVTSGTSLCFRGGFGAELGANTFAEIALTLADAQNNIKANTLGIYLGYRF